jgi:hypothetical protein
MLHHKTSNANCYGGTAIREISFSRKHPVTDQANKKRFFAFFSALADFCTKPGGKKNNI